MKYAAKIIIIKTQQFILWVEMTFHVALVTILQKKSNLLLFSKYRY
jgi:hypothetical protein